MKKHIFICGGSNKYQWGALDSVEKYSIETDSWSPLCPMNFKRSRPEVVALGKYIYALGGSSSTKVHVEKVTYSMFNIWVIPCNFLTGFNSYGKLVQNVSKQN